MASFPAPFPTNNPYAGEAAGYASSSASVFNAIRAAASQHAALMQRDKEAQVAASQKKSSDYQKSLQQDFENHNALMKQGGIPAEVYASGAPAPGRPTLMTPEPNPAAQGQGQTIIEPNGTKTYIPTASEKEQSALNDSNSFTLSEDLAAEARKMGLTNVQAGFRYPKADAEFINQRLDAYHKANSPEPETFTYDDKNFVDENGKPVLALKGNRGTIKRAVLTGGGSPGGPFDLSSQQQLQPGDTLNAPDNSGPPAYGFRARTSAPSDALTFAPPSKKPNPQAHYAGNDSGDVTGITFDPATGQFAQGPTFKGVGQKRKDPDAAPGTKPVSASQLRIIETTKSTNMQKALGQYRKDLSEAITDDDKRAATRQPQAVVSVRAERIRADAFGCAREAHSPQRVGGQSRSASAFHWRRGNSGTRRESAARSAAGSTWPACSEDSEPGQWEPSAT